MLRHVFLAVSFIVFDVNASDRPCDDRLDPRVRNMLVRRVERAQTERQTEMSTEILNLGFPAPSGRVTAHLLAAREVDGRVYAVVGSRHARSVSGGTLTYFVIDRDGRVAEFDESARPAALDFDVVSTALAERHRLGRADRITGVFASPTDEGWSVSVHSEKAAPGESRRKFVESYTVLLRPDLTLRTWAGRVDEVRPPAADNPGDTRLRRWLRRGHR